jgi:hypothetical protein
MPIFVPQTASGAFSQIMPASSRARSMSFSCGTTSVTSPTSYARCALMRSLEPKSAMRRQTASGTRRDMFTISCEDTSPIDTCGSTKNALSDAIGMSDSVTKSSENPAHAPFTAAITGLKTRWRRGVGRSTMFSMSASSRHRSGFGKPPVASPSTSAPVEKPFPAPVRIAHHTSGSFLTSRHASRSSSLSF